MSLFLRRLGASVLLYAIAAFALDWRLERLHLSHGVALALFCALGVVCGLVGVLLVRR